MSFFFSNSAVANIGVQQRRRRLYTGTVLLTIGIALIGGLMLQDLSAWWRLGALPFFWLGLLGLFQAREKT